VWLFRKGREDNIDLIPDPVVEGERDQVAHAEPIDPGTASRACH
jgi:hypothetical protein